jgi:flagellar hook-associated protein 3
MRITDSIITNSYLSGLSRNKTAVQNLQVQLASESKINKPSDSPSGTARSIRISNQLSDNEVYSKNIAEGQSVLNLTINAMDSIQQEMDNIAVVFTNLKNPINSTQKATYADYIDNSLSAIINAANSEYDGKYIFAGTATNIKPFELSADGSVVQVKADDISGKQYVKTAPNISQKINISGAELFESKVSVKGNVSSDSADPQTSTTEIYDAAGTKYNLNISYTKTDDNTYDMKYDVVDGSGSSVFSDTKSVKFNKTNGNIETIGGEKADSININVPGKNIYFMLDAIDVTEKTGSAGLSSSADQKTNIFNTLIRIRDDLKAGKDPSQEDIDAVTSFNTRLSQKESDAGNMINSMSNTDDLLTGQNTELKSLLSKEKDIDVAQGIMDLQNKEYLLQMSYKVASIILPKSLVDYL